MSILDNTLGDLHAEKNPPPESAGLDAEGAHWAANELRVATEKLDKVMLIAGLLEGYSDGHRRLDSSALAEVGELLYQGMLEAQAEVGAVSDWLLEQSGDNDEPSTTH